MKFEKRRPLKVSSQRVTMTDPVMGEIQKITKMVYDQIVETMCFNGMETNFGPEICGKDISPAVGKMLDEKFPWLDFLIGVPFLGEVCVKWSYKPWDESKSNSNLQARFALVPPKSEWSPESFFKVIPLLILTGAVELKWPFPLPFAVRHQLRKIFPEKGFSIIEVYDSKSETSSTIIDHGYRFPLFVTVVEDYPGSSLEILDQIRKAMYQGKLSITLPKVFTKLDLVDMVVNQPRSDLQTLKYQLSSSGTTFSWDENPKYAPIRKINKAVAAKNIRFYISYDMANVDHYRTILRELHPDLEFGFLEGEIVFRHKEALDDNICSRLEWDMKKYPDSGSVIITETTARKALDSGLLERKFPEFRFNLYHLLEPSGEFNLGTLTWNRR